MSYEKTTWVNGATALSAEHMNHIENGLGDAHAILDNIFNAIYPVGSIYMSVNNTDPGELFGGTWEAWGSGRVPVGVDGSQAEFDTVEEEGGSKDAIIPSHNHSASFSGSALGNHTHTFSGTAVGNHTHTLNATAAENGAHTHTASGNTEYAGTHEHTVKTRTVAASGSAVRSGAYPMGTVYSDSYNVYTSETGNHRHSVSLTTSSAGKHTHTVSGSATAAGAHTPAGTNSSVSAGTPSGTNSSVSAGTPSGTVTVTATGVSVAGKNLQPYITCYMWKRTA